MKKIILTILIIFMVKTIFAFGGITDIYSTADTLKTGDGWTTVNDLITTRYEGMSALICNNTADSVFAYRIRGYLSTTSSKYATIVDSTQITGIDEDMIEYYPNTFGKVHIQLYPVSDTVNYQVDVILKNNNQ